MNRLHTELARAQAKMFWFDDMLKSREAALKHAKRKIDLMDGSLSYRVGRMVITPLS